MRTITIYSYTQTPREVLGRVRLGADNKITFEDFPRGSRILAQLQHGIRDWKNKTQVMPTDGPNFFSRLMSEFSGAMVRAEEDR